MRTWKGWLAKKSAALTRFWLLAYSEIFGTTVVARCAATIESFICTKTEAKSTSFFRLASKIEAVVCPPLTI